MGRNKALLPLNSSFFANEIAAKYVPFGNVLISTGNGDCGLENVGTERIADCFKDCGPAGGLHAVLRESNADAVLFIPCDTPLFSLDAGVFLCSKLCDGYDAVVISDEEGMIHPLTAVYRKSCAAVFETNLKHGIYAIRNILKKLNVRVIPVRSIPNGKDILLNINTPQDYASFTEKLKNM